MSSEYTVIYSPASVSEWDIFFGLLDTSFTYLLFICAAFFIFYKYKESKKKWHKKYILMFSGLIVVFLFFRINHDLTEFDRLVSEKEKGYQAVRNYKKAKKITGILNQLELKSLSWPGNTIKRDKFDLLHFKIDDKPFSANMRIDWNRSQPRDMPLCFEENIKSLLAPYQGLVVQLTYYNFISNYHPTDKSRNLCIVDFSVQKK